MTFGQEALIKIGQLFLGRDSQHDTAEIAQIMGCTEGEIYNALTAARAAYEAHKDWHREHQQAVRNKSGVAA